MSPTSIEVGNRIRYYRKAKKYTQEYLAEKADLHNTYIGQLERGEKSVTVDTLLKITGALDISISEFLNGIEGVKYGNETQLIAFEMYQHLSNQPIDRQKKIIKIYKELDKL